MQLINNQYQIQGLSVIDICENFGTPLYVYDADKIIEKITILKQSFPNINLKIKYACKALTNISVLKLMRKHGVELDVVSPQELELGLMAGYSGDQITFTPSGVSFDEIEKAVEVGAKVNLDNLDVLEKFGKLYGASKPCMLRIKPNVAAGGNHKIMTAHEGSKFGISILQKAEILAIINKYDIKVVGLHQHTGSDIKEANSFLEVADKMFELAMAFPDLEILDFGGGFKVPYKKGDHLTDMHKLGQEISASFQNFCKNYGRDLQLWFEPGKFLVSEAGTFFVKTNVVKIDPKINFVGVNSGLNHLIRPMMYDAYHDIINVSNPDDSIKETYNVVGYICETDTFGTDRELNQVSEGDILAFKNGGAYGYTMASNYNSRFRPAEVLVINGEAKLIRHRETMEDIIGKQVVVKL
ncbi:MAG: diaminopimelate decarboxylase [Bacteroidota bacterium]